MSEKLISNQRSSSAVKQVSRFWELVLLGLRAVMGTGAFVCTGITAGISGPAAILAVVLGAIVSLSSELNRIQLVLASSVEDDAQGYSYGSRYPSAWLGFIASCVFVLGGIAAAATAALGLAGYFLNLLRVSDPVWLIPAALVAIALILVALSKGLYSATIDRLLALATLLSLLFFIVVGLKIAFSVGEPKLISGFSASLSVASIAPLIQTTALMFVAYLGYGQIAAPSERIRQTNRPSAKAALMTLFLAMLFYLGVTIAAIGTVGAPVLKSAVEADVAPLAVAARQFGLFGSTRVLGLGAIAALLGLLLLLMPKLAWVLVAMARQKEVPGALAYLTPRQTPLLALWTVAGAIACFIILIGNVKTIWSFSAFGILIYYAITSLAALQLSAQERLYPRWLTWISLGACLLLILSIEWRITITGCGFAAIGLIWRGINRWSEEQARR